MGLASEQRVVPVDGRGDSTPLPGIQVLLISDGVRDIEHVRAKIHADDRFPPPSVDVLTHIPPNRLS